MTAMTVRVRLTVHGCRTGGSGVGVAVPTDRSSTAVTWRHDTEGVTGACISTVQWIAAAVPLQARCRVAPAGTTPSATGR